MIAVAKDNHLFLPKSQWGNFGDMKREPSGESIVYYNNAENRVIKIRDPFAKAPIKHLLPSDVIYEHLIHNLLFPTTSYHLVGISNDGADLRIVLSQHYIDDKYIIPPQSLIDRYLIEGLGLKPEDTYFYGNEYIAVTDVSAEGDNVLFDGEQLYFINPLIRMKRPAVEILEHYYSLLK